MVSFSDQVWQDGHGGLQLSNERLEFLRANPIPYPDRPAIKSAAPCKKGVVGFVKYKTAFPERLPYKPAKPVVKVKPPAPVHAGPQFVVINGDVYPVF